MREPAFVRLPRIERVAETLYDERMPYHNFDHVRFTLRAAARLVKRAHTEGVKVDGEIVYLALLFHDAGYHEDHVALGYPTKEAYSAALAMQHLAAAGYAKSILHRVEAAILSTHRDATFHTPEQKAVRAADLSGLAAPYAIFRANAERLRVEWQMMSGSDVSWPAWVPRVIVALRLYLQQNIRLTRYYSDHSGRSIFHLRSSRNLHRLAAEAPGRETESALESLPAPYR
jgi:predicted metal-dependent HD superfamily phosphohydrolase